MVRNFLKVALQTLFGALPWPLCAGISQHQGKAFLTPKHTPKHLDSGPPIFRLQNPLTNEAK